MRRLARLTSEAWVRQALTAFADDVHIGQEVTSIRELLQAVRRLGCVLQILVDARMLINVGPYHSGPASTYTATSSPRTVLWKAAERQRARMAGLTSAEAYLASPEWQRRIDEALMQTGSSTGGPLSDAAPASSLPRRHHTHLL
eukprot:s2934_g5.t1